MIGLRVGAPTALSVAPQGRTTVAERRRRRRTDDGGATARHRRRRPPPIDSHRRRRRQPPSPPPTHATTRPLYHYSTLVSRPRYSSSASILEYDPRTCSRRIVLSNLSIPSLIQSVVQFFSFSSSFFLFKSVRSHTGCNKVHPDISWLRNIRRVSSPVALSLSPRIIAHCTLNFESFKLHANLLANYDHSTTPSFDIHIAWNSSIVIKLHVKERESRQKFIFPRVVRIPGFRPLISHKRTEKIRRSDRITQDER